MPSTTPVDGLSSPVVEIGNANSVELHSAAQVAAVIRALLDAGRIAFPKSELDDVWTPQEAALLERFQDLMQELGSTRAFLRELVSRRDRQLEFGAAVTEVCERAGRPLDTNRLVAATIRLRNAQDALHQLGASDLP